MIETESSIL